MDACNLLVAEVAGLRQDMSRLTAAIAGLVRVMGTMAPAPAGRPAGAAPEVATKPVPRPPPDPVALYNTALGSGSTAQFNSDFHPRYARLLHRSGDAMHERKDVFVTLAVAVSGPFLVAAQGQESIVFPGFGVNSYDFIDLEQVFDVEVDTTAVPGGGVVVLVLPARAKLTGTCWQLTARGRLRASPKS